EIERALQKGGSPLGQTAQRKGHGCHGKRGVNVRAVQPEAAQFRQNRFIAKRIRLTGTLTGIVQKKERQGQNKPRQSDQQKSRLPAERLTKLSPQDIAHGAPDRDGQIEER